MKILYDYLDDEHFLEIALTEEENLAILAGEMIIREISLFGKIFNMSLILDREEENATY